MYKCIHKYIYLYFIAHRALSLVNGLESEMKIVTKMRKKNTTCVCVSACLQSRERAMEMIVNMKTNNNKCRYICMYVHSHLYMQYVCNYENSVWVAERVREERVLAGTR